MAIIFVVLQILFCITLTMTKPPASTNPNGVWFYQLKSVYNFHLHNTSLPPQPIQRCNQSTAVRDDYRCTPGIGAHKVHIDAANWADAWLRCRLEGADLSVINSEAERILIVELLARAGPAHNGNLQDRAYMGFHCFYYPKIWLTLDGKNLSETGFTEWHEGEPSGGANERCGSVYSSDGKLNDQECGATTSFICEKPCC